MDVNVCSSLQKVRLSLPVCKILPSSVPTISGVRERKGDFFVQVISKRVQYLFGVPVVNLMILTVKCNFTINNI